LSRVLHAESIRARNPRGQLRNACLHARIAFNHINWRSKIVVSSKSPDSEKAQFLEPTVAVDRVPVVLEHSCQAPLDASPRLHSDVVGPVSLGISLTCSTAPARMTAVLPCLQPVPPVPNPVSFITANEWPAILRRELLIWRGSDENVLQPSLDFRSSSFG
jgi:hypothetical protein